MDFVPVDMLDFRANQLEEHNERKKFSEKSIIRILKEGETSENAREVYRLHNITEQTFYHWRNKYYGMKVSYARNSKAWMKRTPS